VLSRLVMPAMYYLLAPRELDTQERSKERLGGAAAQPGD